ncbi:hypothetical protein H6G00_01650 [Leptolyngbya sp. FACHB-541]|uniref:hypothetical protein n=1 Tax=Leptolyngbya sp. FACHB-541 TaxID=2692810 RepID=UPI0016835CBC|nr:hypothetical protein [Leptolyngbya sp. FACHB-541]MBD1995335.1 hypothetical protein [Leptolyngbya sp. FACHB-541]
MPPITRKLERKIYSIDPRKLTLLSRNAHYMTARQMERLSGNVARDGLLTSVPLVYFIEEELLVLSGNHRVQSAIKAGLDEIDVMEILTPLTEEELVSLQLSHNSIVGQDDPTILLELYEGLPLNEKLYSGLTDDDFNIEPLDLSGLSVKAPDYQEVNLLFLPNDADALKSVVDMLMERKKFKPALAASYNDFNRFFSTIVTVKEKLQISNTAVAVRLLIDLAVERLEQLEAEEAEAADQPTEAAPAPEPVGV